VRENVTISYRGANFELGRGQNFYGIWPAAAPQAGPIEWWPETPEGWHGAWSRFTSVEVPGTIAPAGPPSPPALTGLAAIGLHGTTPPADQATTGQPTPGQPTTGQATFGQPTTGQASASAQARTRVPRVIAPVLRAMGAVPPDPAAPAAPAAPATASPRSRTVIAAGLLAAGVALGIAGLFPGYLTSQALVQHQPEELVPHLIYLVGWAVAAALILLGGARQRTGALLATGLSIVTLGLFVSDVGQVTSSHLSFRAGLVLSLAGWLVCAAGSGLALLLRPAGGAARPLGRMKDPALAVTLALLAALGAAAAFVPAWDGYTLRSPIGVIETATAGYAFSQPALMVTGTVLVMIGLVLTVLIAALWRPVRLGAALLAGAAIPMVAQAVSAVIQIREGATPALFSIPPAQASRLGITVSTHLTWSFWLYAAFVAALAAIFVWMLLPVRQAVPAGPSPVGTPPPPPPAPPADARVDARVDAPPAARMDTPPAAPPAAPAGTTTAGRPS
jgi:hypothetical protein